ncbi:MAG: ABC transporter ATP-binding protein [Deltaproteobacteria bacterium]|nr:ABC transporter ATP-binding protein [Deltaproteobacteria bacterium]
MTNPPHDDVLVVKDLQVSFRLKKAQPPVLRRVSFSLEPGKTLGIVGESGSGKSVTCLALMGLLPRKRAIVEGEVLLNGRNLLKLSEREMRSVRGRQIGMIFQDPMTSLNPFMRVGRQLAEVLEVHEGLSRRRSKRRSLELMERVGIADAGARYQHYPHQFSGGMQQHLMIAMALLCRPRVLIADEPTTALDVTIQAQILELIRGLAADFGTAVLFITHDLGVIAGIADEVMVMYAGRAVEKAPVRQLFEQPLHPYTKALLRAVPNLYSDGPLIAIEGSPPLLHAPPSGCAFHPRCQTSLDSCAVDEQNLCDLNGRSRQLACSVICEELDADQEPTSSVEETIGYDDDDDDDEQDSMGEKYSPDTLDVASEGPISPNDDVAPVKDISAAKNSKKEAHER